MQDVRTTPRARATTEAPQPPRWYRLSLVIASVPGPSGKLISVDWTQRTKRITLCAPVRLLQLAGLALLTSHPWGQWLLAQLAQHLPR